MTKHARSWTELGLLAAHIAAVIFLFRLIDDRRLAGVIAGSLFLEIGVLLAFLEVKFGRGLKSLVFWAAAFFLVVSAIPVMSLRLTHWDMAFDEIEWMGLTGRQLHSFSNATYLLMAGAVIIEAFRDRLQRIERLQDAKKPH